ncbi:hypothetical protein SDC9_181220 [bioreactor metagenome]|uniref:Uncharacterized protein n=1 Tax=bioreactor metagenome TaxID=1076179 RepID=A0A645H6N0_9ZZZZ
MAILHSILAYCYKGMFPMLLHLDRKFSRLAVHHMPPIRKAKRCHHDMVACHRGMGTQRHFLYRGEEAQCFLIAHDEGGFTVAQLSGKQGHFTRFQIIGGKDNPCRVS